MLIANTRMYNVDAAVEGLWSELLLAVSARAEVPLDIVAHKAPAPLADLWSRPGLGCVFMCGWPFWRMRDRFVIVAAPVPAAGPCDGPHYCTDLVVRAASGFHSLADTFGGRIGWTDEASHSGFNAPRRLLLDHRQGSEGLYREAVGPLITPRASLMSVVEDRADVAPLDSYFHALLRRHEPDLAAQIRTVARTACAPIPPLVAGVDAPADAIEALRAALCGAGEDEALRPVLEGLCLSGFAAVSDPESYALAERWDEEARRAGYAAPA